MKAPRRDPPSTAEGWSFEENRRRQLVRGLELTPAQRLRWLEEMVALFRRAKTKRER